MGSESPGAVLVVDDDPVSRGLLTEILSRQGYQVGQASDGSEALRQVVSCQYPVILSDIQMLELGGMQLLSRLKETSPASVVILITGHGCLEGAVEAIHEGAFDYLSKPVRPEDLGAVVARAFRHWGSRLPRKAELVREGESIGRGLIGKSSKMIQVYKMLAKASMSRSTVLITGESGTGKELVARAIRDNSALKDKPFVTVNCGALADTLLESELFGHVKGAFTGALYGKRGLFDEANGGTIFLDEVGDISPNLQVKLLRVIQEGEFKPVGTNESRRVEARVIAATHRNLDEAVRHGRFREDLYYRLKVILVDLPPLRERMEDLSDLVQFFLKRFSAKSQKPVRRVSPEAMTLLKSHHWPGNIRELEHAIERAVAMTSTSVLYPEDFPAPFGGAPHQVAEPATVAPITCSPRGFSLEEMERAHIVRTLEEVRYNKSRAAHLLGIDRATLYRKAHRYGIRLGDPKAAVGEV